MMRGAHRQTTRWRSALTQSSRSRPDGSIGVVLIGAITIMREVGVDITAIVTGLDYGASLALVRRRWCVRINGIFLLARTSTAAATSSELLM
jgi:hypothetical protein